jgi:hypothetical protein
MRADVLMSTMLAPISNTDFPQKNALFCYSNSSDGGVQTDRSRPSQCSQEHRSDYGKTSSARLQCHFQAPLINKSSYEVNFPMEHAYLQVASPESLEANALLVASAFQKNVCRRTKQHLQTTFLQYCTLKF